MSTEPRIVPVTLKAGREYLLRNGRQVTIIDNPHWQCAARYPFAVIQGPDFVVYYDEKGSTGGDDSLDVMRPVYVQGQRYATVAAGIAFIESVDSDSDTLYALTVSYSVIDQSFLDVYTRKGERYDGSPGQYDLLDYAPEILAAPAAVPDSNGWVGKRVSFREDSRVLYGYVKEQRTTTQYYVEVDAPFEGHGVNGRMWFVACSNMTEVPELVGERVDLLIVDDVDSKSESAIVLPSPDGALESAVGRSLVLAMHGKEYTATVIGADDWYYTIEFAEGTDFPGMWDCNGQCPSGRGWLLNHADEGTLFRFSEADAQPQVESSEALDDDDRAACWAAFVSNPSIWIDQWVAARKELRRM